MIRLLGENAAANDGLLFGLDDPDQGIVHVVAPELGLTQPGITLVCGDSHTSTHGAFGALAFGIGASEVAHVLATQTLWQKRPRTLRISVDGRLGAHRSEEHTSELQSLMRNSYDVFCLQKTNTSQTN